MTDPMVILMEKGRNSTSLNLIIGAATHNTVRNRTVLRLQKINIAERETKRQRMVCILNITGDNESCRLNPEHPLDIYLVLFMESECFVVAAIWSKKE